MLPRAHSPNEWMDAGGARKAALIYAAAAIHYLKGSQ
jgi:acetylornithine deacetylase/succinyl-diaminopimelate desuccinylase-like protein